MESVWKSKLYSDKVREHRRAAERSPEWNIFPPKKREELYTPCPSKHVSIKGAARSRSWQELTGNDTASQQCKNILRNYSDYNKRQGFRH